MSADYNGWNDLPEAEREALDILELDLPGDGESTALCIGAGAAGDFGSQVPDEISI